MHWLFHYIDAQLSLISKGNAVATQTKEFLGELVLLHNALFIVLDVASTWFPSFIDGMEESV